MAHLSNGGDEQQQESVENARKNKIQVSNTKKPLFFYVQGNSFMGKKEEGPATTIKIDLGTSNNIIFDSNCLIGMQTLPSLGLNSPEGADELHLNAINVEESQQDLEGNSCMGKEAFIDMGTNNNIIFDSKCLIGVQTLPSLGSESPEGVDQLHLNAINIESQPDFEGMDIEDLPQVDENWSPMHEFEEMTWDSVDEEEKACSDRSMASTSRTPIFSKVFDLGTKKGSTYVAIPKSCITSEGSPTKVLLTQPTMLDIVTNATQRIRIEYKDGAGNDHRVYATGFLASPTMVITAKHALNKERITEIKVHGGIKVLANNFETDVALEGSDVQLTRKACSKAKDTDGLFIHGADIGCFKIQDDCESFLLPCSPTYLSTKNVAILSYPSVDKFLKRAKEELVKAKSRDAVIWQQYWPAMKSFYENSIKEDADAQGIRVAKARTIDSITKAACSKAKQSLYTELLNTFGITHTGNMVCSVGNILCANKVCIGTSCSTLAGSSGAAICPLERPGEFVGTQRGGSSGFDLNLTTSVDNREFVEFYMAKILPTLPHPDDSSWTRRSIDGFHNWLCLHGKHIPTQSPWYGVLDGKKSVFKKRLKRKSLFA